MSQEIESAQRSSNLDADALAHAITRALILTYEGSEPPQRAWERIIGRAARPVRTSGRERHPGIQPTNAMMWLEPQLGVARFPPSRRRR